MTTASLRDSILEADDLALVPVEVAEWGLTLYVRQLRGVERDAFEQSMFEVKGDDLAENLANLRARYLVLCIVDEAGERVFTADDADALGQKNGKALDTLYDRARKVNGLTPADVEELAGNSSASPGDDSTLRSPSG